jgi:hypothetical protein
LTRRLMVRCGRIQEQRRGFGRCLGQKCLKPPGGEDVVIIK